jgi:hypothetical protein
MGIEFGLRNFCRQTLKKGKERKRWGRKLIRKSIFRNDRVITFSSIGTASLDSYVSE